MSNEMVIGLPTKRGEDVFIRDKEGKVVGLKNTEVKIQQEDPAEVKTRKENHDNRIKHEKKNGYKVARAAVYPSFGEFADMMYWRIDAIIKAGIKVTAAEMAWYEKCKDIKLAIPEPTE